MCCLLRLVAVLSIVSTNLLVPAKVGAEDSQLNIDSQPSIASKPNIIVIFADDLGYGDVSCYGATKIRTPNIDRLASEGIRLTDAHSAASICSPSRYGLLTGHSPWRLHKKGNGYSIPTDRPTIASILKTQGYTSAAIGKWHLGYSKDWNKLPITGPLERGFDYHFGVPKNHNDSTRCYIENHDIVGRKPGEKYRIARGQDFPDGLAEPRVDDLVETKLAEKAVQFIRESADRPFFLYYASCTPHTHITPAAKFRGTSQCGLLGDYVQELDHHVGQVMAVLDELGIAENTLLIFTSDNGGTPRDFTRTQDVNLNLASEKGHLRQRFFRAKRQARKRGHITNGPWRDGKGRPWEGGHRVPFIARWPGKIAPATTSDYLLTMTDIMATAAEVAGAELPNHAGEDSFSAVPVLLGQTSDEPQREAIFVQGDPKDIAISICTGRWKMVYSRDSNGGRSAELFDLTVDPSETDDIAEANPDLVERLATAFAKAEADGRTRP